MPKEMTHFLVADAVLDSLPEGDLKTFLKKHHHLVRIGSVSYDTAFYGFSSRFSDFYDKTLMIHGQNTSDITFPYKNVQSYTHTDFESALTAGAITHLAADSIFHPMVFYFTGWDLHQHYRMEAAMDLFFLKMQGYSFPQSLKTSLKDQRRNLDGVALWLVRFLGLNKERRTAAYKQYKRHGNVQKLLYCPVLRGVTGLLARILPNKFHEIYGSFYRRRRDFSKSFYTQTLSFRYPVDGTEKSADLNTLFHQAVERGVSLIQQWWDNPSDSSFPASFSPVTGLHPEKGTEFKFQAEQSPDI